MVRIPVPVVLASSSSTRRELLCGLVEDFQSVAPDVDEGPVDGCEPKSLALKLAEEKARAVARARSDALVIGADTLVACEGEVMGKPIDLSDAVRILLKLTRCVHKVVTAVFIIAPDGRERAFCVESLVRMRPMTREEAEEYLSRTDALDKAGAYALGPDDPNVESIEGSVTAVMGLPLDELKRTLQALYADSERIG
ncbi:MAG: Maf family protein [Planctomycetota bacterium]